MIEVRAAASEAQDSGRLVHGYAIRCDDEAVIGGLFRERISIGAVRSADVSDVLGLLHHDMGRVIGRTKSGTLRLKADARGLAFELDLPKSPDGDTALELVRRRDLKSMSFGFHAVSEEWSDNGALPLRVVTALDLVEISIVGDPAYPTTSVALKIAASRKTDGPHAARLARMRMRMAQSVRGLRP